MTLIVSADTGSKFLIDEGSYLARCCWVIDLGTQQSDFGPKRKLLLAWELPEVLRTFDDTIGPEPATVTKFYTASLSEKANLRKDLELWRGRAFSAEELAGFDLRKLLGVPCLLTITHRANAAGEKRATVAGLGKLPRGVEVPAASQPTRLYDLDEPNHSVFSELPQWLRDVIAESSEYQAMICGGNRQDQQPDVEIPF